MSLVATTTADLVHGVIVVDIDGLLTLESVPTVRRTLRNAFAQAPDAVIVNLARMRAVNSVQLTVFPTVVRIHAAPPVALLLCAASPELAALMDRTVLGGVPVYATYPEALSAVEREQRQEARRLSVRLDPSADAQAKARGMVRAACREWDLAHLAVPATLIVSELVGNAVEHAGTEIHLTIAQRGDFLHINVRDGSPETLRPRSYDLADVRSGVRGRGLLLIDVYATVWGSNVTDTGKIVWATLRAAPVLGG